MTPFKRGITISQIAPIILIGLLTLLFVPSQAQKMGPFCSFSLNYDKAGQVSIGPYVGTVKYFNFFEEDNIADDTSQHKNKYYFYFNLPESTTEIGARIISPIPTTILPCRGDQVAVNYFENESNKFDFFDPVIVLEKCISDESGNGYWVELGKNDDSEELPAQPTGERKNALIRVPSDTTDVIKMLVPGMYRLVVSDKNNNPAVGGCFLQLGVTRQVSGLRLYRDPAEMRISNFSCKF